MLSRDRMAFPVNARVRHEDRGAGVVEAVQGRTIRVRFDGEAETTVYNPRGAPIERLIWSVDDQVLIRNMNIVGVVTRVDLDGGIRADLADLLLDSFDWQNPPLPFDPIEFPDWIERVERARLHAEIWVEEQLAREVEERRSSRREEHETERQKLDRYCSYREQEGRNKIDHDELIVTRLRASDREEDRRVAPIWERTLQNNRESLRHVEKDCARLMADLERRATISYSYDLLSAAWVQIVPPSDGQLQE